MKIAIPTMDEKLCRHFGHCDVFTIFEIDSNNQIIDCKKEIPPPHEPGVLPKWLGSLNVDVIIAGGMGMRAQQLFSENNVKVVVGAEADKPEDIINAYLTDTLITGANVCDH